jgi:hypothetical protein
MSTPVGAVQGQNAHKGVKRSVQGNPVGVPRQLPGFRGRSVDAGGPVKAPKLRNGNLNNETSNVRIPYNVVCPLEFLSSYQGRLGPGDLCFRYRYPPGFTNSQAAARNATLGVNTLSRVVGLDGLNRLLMGSGPNGWRLGENVYEVPETKFEDGAYGVLSSTTGVFALTTLNEYPLQGIVISNDEPGAFTSNGNRDNCIFNLAIQGPTETNNGFLMYENPTKATEKLYNPLTGVTNSRTVEAHARGSSESGMHIENTHMPGRVGSDFQKSRGKVDFVANFCGTYAMYPSQMFDRRIESMNTLHVGLRAYDLSLEAKRQVTTATGEKRFPESMSDAAVQSTTMYFYQYLPFSSRVAHVIQAVTDTHFEMTRDKIATANGVDAATITAGEVRAFMEQPEEVEEGRIKAALRVGSIKQQTATSLPSAHFDKATYDPIRSEDLWNCVGAWSVGRVLDTKAAVHERYAGGPRDTAFSCIVDVQVAWRAAVAVQISPDTKANVTGFLLEPSERTERSGQQTTTTLANNLSPALKQVFGADFGRDVTPAPNIATQNAADSLRETRMQRQQEVRRADAMMARMALAKKGQQGAGDDATVKEVAAKMANAATAVRRVLGASPSAALIDELVGTTKFGLNPMDTIRALLRVDGVAYADPDPEADSSNLWASFYEYRQECSEAETRGQANMDTYYTLIGNAKKKWQDKASDEIGSIMNTATPKLTSWFPNEEERAIKAAIRAKIAKYVAAMKEAKEATEAAMGKGDDAMDAAMSTQLSNILNRANIFLVLFHQVMTRLGDRTGQESFVLKTCSKDIAQALEESALVDETLHLSTLCDLYEKHFPVDATYYRLTALARQMAASAAPAPAAPAPAPAPVRAAAAAPAAVATGASAGARAPTKGRGKSPAKPRPGAGAVATGASAAAAARPAAAPTPTPTPTPTGTAAAVPAAAAGMSSTPLVPTQTGAASDAAVPRRRAREAAGGGESVTNSLFENMFKSTGADASAEDQQPASPTPSSGSEGPSGGPRTFRRQR